MPTTLQVDRHLEYCWPDQMYQKLLENCIHLHRRTAEKLFWLIGVNDFFGQMTKLRHGDIWGCCHGGVGERVNTVPVLYWMRPPRLQMSLVVRYILFISLCFVTYEWTAATSCISDFVNNVIFHAMEPLAKIKDNDVYYFFSDLYFSVIFVWGINCQCCDFNKSGI